MTHPPRWLLLLLVCAWLAAAQPAGAQSPTSAPTATPSPTMIPTVTPSPAPAIMVIQATPVPTPAPQGNWLQQTWVTYQREIILGLIAALTGLLVGVFLKQFATTLAKGASRLFHCLFDRFASAPILRWRFDKTYRETLAAALQRLASSNIVDREVRLDEKCTCRSG